MNITIMKEISFCAGHRLVNHGGKCENLHGHNYLAQIFVTGSETDSVGRLVDFSMIKKLFKTWIDEHWDHAMILWDQDKVAIDALQLVQPNRIHAIPFNPTAENMARYLVEFVAPELMSTLTDYQVGVSKVIIWETPTSSASVSVDAPSVNGHVAAHSWQKNIRS